MHQVKSSQNFNLQFPSDTTTIVLVYFVGD